MFYHSTQTIDEWKAWLSQNPITVYAVLKTPIETPLTASEVASIRQLQTYKGTTIIDSEMDVVSVTYSGDVKGYVDGFHTYSTTPTICGYEEDGTPIYKVKIYTTTPSADGVSQTVSASLTSNMCNLKDIKGSVDVGGGIFTTLNCWFSSTAYVSTFLNQYGVIMKVGTYNNRPCEIIVEYTLKEESGIALLSEGEVVADE